MGVTPSLISFVAISKRRREVLSILQKKSISQHELRRITNMYKSHISRTLKELSEKNLILCINPNDKAFRFYKINSLGKRVLKEVERLLS